jgi:hypothetical protein
VILHRCFPWDESAAAAAPGGALWFPRPLQGEGRHDAPERYGCLYVSEEPVAAVAEWLAPLAGTALAGADLRRSRLPLALAALRLEESASLIDLDEPLVLAAAGLRPSLVATGDRARSQADAEALWERHAPAAGLRWWSALDARWANVTLFDRARGLLSLERLAPLSLSDTAVGEAAVRLGLRVIE